MFNLPLLSKNKVIYYTSSSGRDPIHDFISAFNQQTITKTYDTIRFLEENGLRILTTNQCKKIHNKPAIFELRIKSHVQIRLLFFEPKKNIFIILNAFVKKKQKTPPKEIKTAIKRSREFI